MDSTNLICVAKKGSLKHLKRFSAVSSLGKSGVYCQGWGRFFAWLLTGFT